MRYVAGWHSPVIDQAVPAEFISEGHFARHVRRMRALYEERQQILVAEAKRHLKGLLEVAPDVAGMHLVGLLPEGVDDLAVAAKAKEANLRISPLSRLCLKRKTARRFDSRIRGV